MTIIEHFLLFLITTILITLCVNALKDCEDCGHIKVPYPLSTSPNCGDPNYKIRCNSGMLWFDTINGSSYIITSINPTLQRLVIQPPGLANNTCMSRDFKNEGMWLDTNSPFNITSSNTLILMNCSLEILTMLFNCSSTSICHKYIEEGNAVISKNCGVTSHASKLCCDVKTGGSATSHRIRVREDRCAAYASFPNLDPSLPVSMWRPGVEIEWQLPAEPSCKVAGNCLDVANSRCLPDPVAGGEGKCLCNAGFQWDPVNGKCQAPFKGRRWVGVLEEVESEGETEPAVEIGVEEVKGGGRVVMAVVVMVMAAVMVVVGEESGGRVWDWNS
ncbi:hypothetical protein AHAS_Ahas04G0134100 [Arachis hypogaea]